MRDIAMAHPVIPMITAKQQQRKAAARAAGVGVGVAGGSTFMAAPTSPESSWSCGGREERRREREARRRLLWDSGEERFAGFAVHEGNARSGEQAAQRRACASQSQAPEEREGKVGGGREIRQGEPRLSGE